jgi:hypothetical protein
MSTRTPHPLWFVAGFLPAVLIPCFALAALGELLLMLSPVIGGGFLLWLLLKPSSESGVAHRAHIRERVRLLLEEFNLPDTPENREKVYGSKLNRSYRKELRR